VIAPTAVLARIRPPLVALALLVFIVGGIPASGGPANLASTPIIVAGRSHHVPHQVIGSVPVRLLHESPYPVLTIP
jgi:hypothetical protein